MKCDHIRTREQGDTPFFPNMLNNGSVEVCLKEDVDAAIEELKEKLRDHCASCPVKEQEDDVVADLKKKLHDAEMRADLAEAANTEYREDIKKLKAENESLKAELQKQKDAYSELDAMYQRDTGIACNAFGQGSVNCKKLRATRRALWLMTAEWAEGMGLASCNIAIKLSFKERFFYHDEANREKDIKKYRHRQVVFYKYADYCRKKAEEYK